MSDRSREVEEVGLGSALPGSARSLRSTTAKTPQSRRSSSRQPSQTPATRSRGPSSIRSARHNSRGPERGGLDAAQPQGLQPEEFGHKAKRRRISSSFVTPTQPVVEIPTVTATNSRRSKRQSSRKVFTIIEDDDAGRRLESFQSPGTVAPSQLHNSPLPFLEEESNKENDTAGVTNDSQGHSASTRQDVKDDHFGLPSAVDILPGSRTFALAHVTDDGGVSEDNGTREDNDDQGSGKRDQFMSDENSLQTSDRPEPSNRKRRKKRKSVVLVRKKKRSSGHLETGSEQTETPTHSLVFPGPSNLSPASTPLSANQTRVPRSLELNPQDDSEGVHTSYRARSPKETEDDDDGTYVQDSSPDPQTPAPAPAKKAGQVARRRKTPDREPRDTRTKKSKPKFPILTHRLTNLSRLPTIHEVSEDEDHSQRASGVPFDLGSHRSQPNVVDVLSQICRETIENLVGRISENVQPSERSVLRNKRSALEEFGHDLDNELFELSEAVENRINLEALVRKRRREKSSLQTEWVELRKEREQIALKCDAVRRRHWECEDAARERWDLSEAARRAELELGQHDHSNEGGFEFLLRSVVDTVSSATEEGGLLDRVKSFNAHLENMALFLEGRNGR